MKSNPPELGAHLPFTGSGNPPTGRIPKKHAIFFGNVSVPSSQKQLQANKNKNYMI